MGGLGAEEPGQMGVGQGGVQRRHRKSLESSVPWCPTIVCLPPDIDGCCFKEITAEINIWA